MRYGFIIGDKPTSNKKSDNRGTKGGSSSASMEYKEDEPIIIGKAADGRIMKQLSVTKGAEYNDYIMRVQLSDPVSIIDSFEILSITGSIKMPYKNTCSYLPLTCTLSDLNSDYGGIQKLLSWYNTDMFLKDTEIAILLATPVYTVSFTPSAYKNRNVMLNLCIETPVLNTIISTLRERYTEGMTKIDEATYTSIMTSVNRLMSESSVHLTITYLVKE